MTVAYMEETTASMQAFTEAPMNVPGKFHLKHTDFDERFHLW